MGLKFQDADPLNSYLPDSSVLGVSDYLGPGSYAPKGMTGLDLRKGSDVSTTPLQWTGAHGFDTLVGGKDHPLAVQLANGGAPLQSGNTNGMSSIMARYTTGDYSGDTEHKSTGNQMINLVQGILGVPTVGIASPIEAINAVVSYDPVLNGGAAVTWPEIRGTDVDLKVVSGSVTNLHGVTSRMRIEASAQNVFGFSAYPLNGNNGNDATGTIANYVGMYVGDAPNLDAPVSGTVVNYAGVKVEPLAWSPPINLNLAMDITGDAFPIRLGSTVKSYIESRGVTGGLGLVGRFTQSGTFDAGNGIRHQANVDLQPGAFYSSAGVEVASIFNDVDAPSSTFKGLNFTLDGGDAISTCLHTVVGDLYNVCATRATKTQIGLRVNSLPNNGDVGASWGIVIGTMDTSPNNGIDRGAIATADVGRAGGIHFGITDATNVSAASPCALYWNGTNLVISINGGVEQVIQTV